MVFTSSNMVVAFASRGYELGWGAATAASLEPRGVPLLATGLALLMTRRVRP